MNELDFHTPPALPALQGGKFIIAVDPGVNLGISYGNALDPEAQRTSLLKLQVGKAQRHHRSGRVWNMLNQAVRECLGPEGVKEFRTLHHRSFQVIFETSEEIQRGNKAVASHARITGVVEAWASLMDVKFIQMRPADLKRYALGKGIGDKEEMVAAAQALGYEGSNDNEADAFLIYRWGVENCIWHR